MNACVVEEFSVYREPTSPARFNPVMIARQRTKTPAQIEQDMRTQQFIDSVVEASNEASEVGSALSFEWLDIGKLAALLPRDISVAESYITPTGSVCFDWDEDPKNQLSIVLQPGGRVGYAAYFDGDRTHGSARFGTSLPEDLALAVRRWHRRDVESKRVSP